MIILFDIVSASATYCPGKLGKRIQEPPMINRLEKVLFLKSGSALKRQNSKAQEEKQIELQTREYFLYLMHTLFQVLPLKLSKKP